LRSRGYSVIEAPNGLKALKALEQKTVDLVVSDVMMPEMYGSNLLSGLQFGTQDLVHLGLCECLREPAGEHAIRVSAEAIHARSAYHSGARSNA
jgi:CheY-like chemotaxis protein